MRVVPFGLSAVKPKLKYRELELPILPWPPPADALALGRTRIPGGSGSEPNAPVHRLALAKGLMVYEGLREER